MKNITFIKIGIIISLSLLALVFGINFLKGKGLFTTEETYHVIYDRIDGLYVSNPVLVNGYKVGQVQEISLMTDRSGRLLVTFMLEEDIQIPTQTVARIFSSDLLGTKAIELKFSNLPTNHQPGDTLIADFEGSLQEMVSLQMLPLKSKAENLMKEMEEAIETVKYIFNEETREDLSVTFKKIKDTFSNLERSTSNLDSIVEGGKSKMEHIITNIESITRNLERNNAAITATMNNMALVSKQLSEADIKNTIAKTNEVLQQIDSITKLLAAGQGTLGKMIVNDTLYYNLVDASYNLNRLMEDLRYNPKRYVHFSAFDMGKTVIVEDYEAKGPKEKVLYTILLVQSNQSIPVIPQNFKGYKNVEEATMEGTYIYVYGRRNNLSKAKELLNEVKVDFPDAEILEIRDGIYKKTN